MSKTLNIPYAELEAPRYVSLPEPYQARLVQVWRMQKLSGGAAHLDTHVAAFLRITESDARATKTALVERGYCDEEWRPTALSGPGYRSSNAERQARHRERRKAATGGAGVTSNAAVTQVVTPRNATSNAGVTRGVTPPPNPPPSKRPTHKAHVQTDSDTHSAGVCGEGVTPAVTVFAPEDAPRARKPACSAEDVRRLSEAVALHFDPIGLSDVWHRHMRTWSVLYPADWIEKALVEVAAKAATDPFVGERWGRSMLERWSKSGGPPREAAWQAREGVPARGGDRSDVPGPRASPAAFQRPLTEHQRKMASLRAVIEEIDDGEAEGEGLGDQGDGQARGAAQLARRA